MYLALMYVMFGTEWNREATIEFPCSRRSAKATGIDREKSRSEHSQSWSLHNSSLLFFEPDYRYQARRSAALSRPRKRGDLRKGRTWNKDRERRAFCPSWQMQDEQGSMWILTMQITEYITVPRSVTVSFLLGAFKFFLSLAFTAPIIPHHSFNIHIHS